MEFKIQELKQDLAELESLQKLAIRHKVADILSLESRKVASEIIKLEETARNAQKPVAAMPVNNTKHYQVKLDKYAWDQTSKNVKFYITLQNVQTLPSENVHCNFTNKSFELTVKNLNDRDYTLVIKNLLKPINPEESIWKVKTDMVIITAAKITPENWSHVTELEKRSSESKKLVPDTNKSEDPTEGLMSIMRNMYEQGDDEMKRTIAKAWTESQEKKQAL